LQAEGHGLIEMNARKRAESLNSGGFGADK
jgi:hypothetical protein